MMAIIVRLFLHWGALLTKAGEARKGTAVAVGSLTIQALTSIKFLRISHSGEIKD